MIISIAWKNIWRKKSRSLVVVAAVTVGTLAGIFFCAWMQGIFDQKVHDSINTEVGHLRIINSKYLLNGDIKYTIPNFLEVKKVLGADKDIKAWVSRIKIESMASNTRKTTGVYLYGVDPIKEKKVSNLYTKIINGTGGYFNKNTKQPSVVIGDKLAEELQIKYFKITDEVCKALISIGLPSDVMKLVNNLRRRRFSKKKLTIRLEDLLEKKDFDLYKSKILSLSKLYSRSKITFTFTNYKGDLSYLTCRPVGIYKTSNNFFDSKNVFIKKKDLIKEFGKEFSGVHEITILANDKINADDINNIQFLKKRLSGKFEDVDVMDIEKTAPDVYSVQIMSKPSMYILMFIIYFALAFGIINTMLMAILERIKELGMLRAIGMKKIMISKMIMLETVFLTLIGTSLGLILALFIVKLTSKTGINIFGDSFEDAGYASVVYPKITNNFILFTVLIIIIIAIVASIFPVYKALKIKNIDALKD